MQAAQEKGLQQGQAAAVVIAQGLTLASTGDFEAALKQFQTAGATNPNLPIEVLDQAIADAQRKNDPTQKNLMLARQYYIATLGLAAVKKGDFEAARADFSKAGAGNPMLPIKFLDQSISDSQSKNDPALSNFKIARQDYMNDTDPFSQTDLTYRRYACEHSAIVVVASAPAAKVDDEVKRWQRIYPTASGGIAGPTNPDYVQIIAASFLTCEQARSLKDELIRKNLANGPFIGGEYSECSACNITVNAPEHGDRP